MSIEITGQPATAVGNNVGGAEVAPSSANATNPQAQNAGQTATDQITITTSAVNMQKAESALKAVPVVDTDRVEQLRLAIKNGEYEVDPAKIAEKFISLESSLFSS